MHINCDQDLLSLKNTITQMESDRFINLTNMTIKLLSLLLLFTLLAPFAYSQKKHKPQENWDLKLLMKDGSEKFIRVFGSDNTSIYTETNLKGPINFNKIDTITVLDDTKIYYFELAWKIPLRTSTNKVFQVKDLFISELPFSNNGELIFESCLKYLPENPINYNRIVSKIISYTKDISVVLNDELKNSFVANISFPLSTATRADKYLFYEYSSMDTYINLNVHNDSVCTKLTVNQYLFEKNYSGTRVVHESERYLPLDLFQNKYFFNQNNRPIKFNNILKNETLSIVEQFFNSINNSTR